MDNEYKKLLEQSENEIISLHENHLLTNEEFYKCIIGLAYEYAIEKSFSKCIKLLKKCDPEYFTGKMKEEMLEDEKFYKVGEILAKSLVDANIVNLMEFNFNKAPAKA